MSWFAEECKILRNAIYIPLGPKVSSAMDEVVKKGILKPSQVLSGLPNPSGANAERIQYFLGKKDKESLSIKTNPKIIDDAKQSVIPPPKKNQGSFGGGNILHIAISINGRGCVVLKLF